MDIFKKENPHEDVEMLVSMVNQVHEERMTIKDSDDEDHMEITKEEFDELVQKLEKKNKRSYDYLIKAGEKFKTVVHRLCKRLIEAETFPARFYETVLHQLWKNKYPRENLGNHRFFSCKRLAPKMLRGFDSKQDETGYLKSCNKIPNWRAA